MKKKEIIQALGADNFSEFYKEANRICKLEKGNQVFMRAIIEFSNYCNRQCAYCGINVMADIDRYRMTKTEIIDVAQNAVKAGYKTIVLQSGEDFDLEIEGLGQIVRAIKQTNDVAITLSCGELVEKDLEYLRECGADRYLLKHETADPKLYRKLHPDSCLEDRVKCLKKIKELGYEMGSGFMVGLPGASIETTTDDLLLLKDLECDMAGIGPFIASPETALADYPSGSPELTKRALAIARILLPKANLPVTTSLGILSKAERKKAFSCGANVIMKKVTPNAYKDKYKIYPAKIPNINIEKDRKDIIEMLAGIGKKGV